MYESFFGLNALPFKITPDPAFIYWNAQHRRAASILAFGIEQMVPITVVTGDVGAGKTTLLQQFLEEAPADMTVGLISNYWSGMGGLYQWILNAFDIKASGSEVELFRMFQDFVISEYAEGRRCVLIVDEAQNIADPDLEQLRMLTNINTGKDSLLMLFLVGQPQLRDRLRQPHNNQIAQRVGASFHLAAMSEEDTQNYVRHRLRIAGATQAIFDTAALKRIHQVSGGVPRLINVVSELALVTAFGDGVKTIDGAYLNAFLEEAEESGMMAHLPMSLNSSEDAVPPPPPRPEGSILTAGRAGAGPQARRIRLVADLDENEPLAPPRRDPDDLIAKSPEPSEPPVKDQPVTVADDAPTKADPGPGKLRDSAAGGTEKTNDGADSATAQEAESEIYRLDNSELVAHSTVFDKLVDRIETEPAPQRQSAPEEDPAKPISTAPPVKPSLPARKPRQRVLRYGAIAVAALALAGAVYVAIRPQADTEDTAVGLQQAPAQQPSAALATASETLATEPTGGQVALVPAAASRPPPPLDDPDGASLLERALNGGAGAPLDYARAALRDQPRAAYYLGQLYETGTGVPRDLALARAWYSLASPEVRSAARRLAVLGPGESGELTPPRPVLGGMRADGGGEFIWTAGPGADAAFYLIELTPDENGPVRRLAPQTLSAVLVDDIGEARFWRVLAVDPSAGRYAVSSWRGMDPESKVAAITPAAVLPQVTVLLPKDISPAQKEIATRELVKAGYKIDIRNGAPGDSKVPQVTHAYETDLEAAKLVADLFGAEAAIKLGPLADPDGEPPLPGQVTVTLPAR